ncbi:putative restriction endonuclease S subunit [Klebsiella quasipneumoniae]|uniref:restriction endonuclease subunit S n=1 Tax=Klebsiella TaxID=570 RepID=UPI00081C1DE8|nr:restriction endonuclease subunit S [Klebsiella quasipneumoniae]HDZ9755059.1 restriction endonuclease subunit S [Klebsiella quasipneumoniae subsp. similipneumoniae]EKY4130693.1 restriction endonuclease subunit S [Klebsiella quasipneumoniae]MBC4926527.1 restriction endonuclease subunit S [Klebsiella quasipneumoniae]MBY5243811.1 restriction endonuclease subunit S [Klebsiella quasipneumoniae]MCE7469650.1 restriction endonuclease subunit S [Klebsiella quasipneumoniae]
MAKYKAYPEYKESGVEWFDVRPLSWKVTRLKLETFMNMGQSPSSDDCNIEGDGLAFLQGNAEFGKVNPIEKQYCPVPKKIANPGDILFSVRAPVGAMNFADKKYGIGRGLCSIAASAKLTSPFLWWLLPTYKYQLDAIATGSTFEAVSAEQLGNLCFALPSISEQSQIAAFLDHETAKIDNLIEKQQQLIELLKEKRQAVISHAVTKGLNPDVPMKYSGVEWLGEVPEHWIIKRLKHISPKVGVGLVINPSTYTKDEGVYFIFGGDVKEFGFDLTKTRRISPQDSNKLLPSRLNSRDLVSVRVGYPGITSVVTDDLEGSNCASIIIIRRGSYNSDWLCAAMNVWVGRQQVDLASYGAAQKQFNVSDAIEFVFPVPPINEQNDIADFVQKTLNKFDDLTQKALKQIELLQERRTALISAAVTGKIDVRDWVAPDTQDVEEPQEATA